ncbi:PREDICTED: uncharacterized protein LOC105972839 [Erythranthe guttata]|uniref:uncharacterized protein LOC105972839 n=1 Tax=Erythranthe guttata TaxID=4155 RepID=UPI00064E065E|nr:PREDICTED: uncharacterized protein LOC105972839 [Erythranthe guttata]|eukprot:XP_012853274.1 PREDICTED: uncharacterized protein LOC105972839 [Erythranthe guttata]
MAAKTNVKVYVYFGGHIIPDDWVVQYSIAHKTAFRIKRDLSFAQFLSKLYQLLDVDVNQFGLRVCCKSYIYNGERMREMITEMTTDRVLRQFGRVQHIPPHPTDHDIEIKLHSYDRRGAGGRDWARFHGIYVDRWHRRLDSPVDYPFIEFRGPQTDPGYYEWYERHTRRLISPIDNLDDIGFQVGDPILLDLVVSIFLKTTITFDVLQFVFSVF